MLQKSIADLKLGEKAVIKGFVDDEVTLKLLEMGCLPDSEVQLCAIAPFGDPICIKVCDYCLSLRKSEASLVLIK